MHDTLEYFLKTPYFANITTTSLPLAYGMPFMKTSSSPLSRRGRIRQGSLLSKMPGDEAQSSRICGCFWAINGSTLGRNCSSWEASSVSGASGTTSRGSTGTSWTTLAIRESSAGSATESPFEDTAALRRDFENAGFEWVDFSDWESSIIAFCARQAVRSPRGMQFHSCASI